jgi:hypothetical protein
MTFESSEELVDKFGDLEGRGYFDPIHLTDTTVGFSIKRNYPKDIRYKPAIGQRTGEPDNFATMWVVYEDRKLLQKPTTLVPVRIRVSNMSWYRTSKWDYDFSDAKGDSPSRESYEASEATPKPLDLSYSNDLFYDHTDNAFKDGEGKTVDGLDFLDRVFSDHCKTVHLFWGLRLRLKLLTQARLAGLFEAFGSLLIWILKVLFGRTIENSDVMAGLYKPYHVENMKKLGADSLNIFGYKASKGVVILFCGLAIVSTYFRFGAEVTNGYWDSVAGSEFSSLVHGIFFLWFLDVVVPRLIFIAINATIRLRAFITFMQMKFP